ncbi:MAG: response regulator [Desulfovibrio sp.]
MTSERNLKILIVEDNPGIRQIIADILRAKGFNNTTYADNGKIGWNQLENDIPNLLILDWDMPVMNGMELLKKIRADEKYETMPILMLTARAEQNDVIQAIQNGATDYIVKPFAPDTLYSKLASIFGQPV